MRKGPIAAGILSLLLVTSVAAYLGIAGTDGDMYQVRKRIYSQSKPVYRVVKRTIQDNDMDNVRAVDPETPAIQLLLSRQDVAHFADLYSKFENPKFGVQHYLQDNKWRKAELVHDGRKYRIKIKSHGRNPSGHRAGKFISFAVKLDGGERLLGYRRFSLIVRNRIQSDRQVLKQLSEDLDLLYHDLFIVRVKINSWEEKLYYLQPQFDDAYFETQNLASMRTFTRSVSPTESSHKSMLNIKGAGSYFDPSVYQSDFLTLLDDEVYSVDQKREIIGRHKELNTVLQAGDYRHLIDYIDLEYIASFDAFRTIAAASEHGFASETNFHVVYDFANGKFYPIVTDDAYWTRLQLEDGQAVEEVLDNFSAKGQPSLLRFFNLLSRNDRIRQRKYERIYETITPAPEELIRQHDAIMAKYDDLHYFGVVKQMLRRFGLSGFPVHTENNIKVLRAYLDAADPRIQLKQFTDGLEIVIDPRSMAGIRISELGLQDLDIGALEEIQVVEESADGPRILLSRSVAGGDEFSESLAEMKALVFSDTVDESSRRRGRTFLVQLRFKSDHPLQPTYNLELVLENAVTEKIVPAVANHVERDEPLPRVRSQYPTEDEMEWKYLQQFAGFLDFELLEGKLVIPEGTYTIDQDVILPEGRKLVLEAGVNLLLGEDVVLMSKNGLEVRGTAQKPVTVAAQDPKRPFGTVGILGNDLATTEIRHLTLSHGRERLVEGVYFSGALSIYHHKAVMITDSVISDAFADDGLNIKYAPHVVIRDTQFRNNFADQVDLDYCDGLVVHSRFSSERGDANGDGLDLSGSKMVVFENEFDSLQDKGLSIGEATRAYLLFNSFVNNNLGVAVKDSSHAYLYGNSYIRNATDLSLFRKKNIWGGATAHLLSPADTLPDFSYTTDSNSRVIHHVLDPAVADSWYAGLAEVPAEDGPTQLRVADYLDFAESVSPR